MREFSIEDNLKKKLSKLSRKDHIIYSSVMKKIEKILTCENVNHYKNLRKPLQDFKRVHIKGSFVLIFKYNESDDKVIFFDFDHHDNIY